MGFKNPYSDKLHEFADAALHEESAVENHGKWREKFAARMGAKPTKLVLELGCSNAHFLGDIAQVNPGVAFVGVDWKYKVLYKGAKRASQNEQKNLLLVRGRNEHVSRMFSEGELDEIWIFFPDPWAKKSQLKHRIFQDQHLADLAKALGPGGRVHVKTDHPGYYQWMCAVMGLEQPRLPSIYDEALDGDERGMKYKQIMMRKPMASGDLPAKGKCATELFAVSATTTEYWGGFNREGRLFEKHVTLFEKGFLEQELPVYFIELMKKDL